MLSLILSLLVLASLFFYRELLNLVTHLILKPQTANLEKEKILLVAQNYSCPKLYFCQSPLLEALIIECWSATHVYVSESFWNQLNLSEREAFLSWCFSAGRHANLLYRWLGFFEVEKIDRDCLLLGAKIESLLSVMERAETLFPVRNPTVAGLSLLGPSLLSLWPTPQQRFERLSQYQLRLASGSNNE